MGQLAFHAKPAVAEQRSNGLVVRGHGAERVHARHGHALVLVLHGVEADVRELLDPANRLELTLAHVARVGAAGDGAKRVAANAVDDLNRAQELEDEGEVGEQDEQAEREHAERDGQAQVGHEAARLVKRRAVRPQELDGRMVEGHGHEDGLERRHHEKAHHEEVDGLPDEELRDAVRVPVRRELHDDGHDRDGDAEHGGQHFPGARDGARRHLRVGVPEQGERTEVTARVDEEGKDEDHERRPEEQEQRQEPGAERAAGVLRHRA